MIILLLIVNILHVPLSEDISANVVFETIRLQTTGLTYNSV